jgi:hypothetical protein
MGSCAEVMNALLTETMGEPYVAVEEKTEEL